MSPHRAHLRRWVQCDSIHCHTRHIHRTPSRDWFGPTCQIVLSWREGFGPTQSQSFNAPTRDLATRAAVEWLIKVWLYCP
jgi:hypothetical protein